MAKRGPYLAEDRLADVLALIQVLAYDVDTSRSEEGLQEEFQRKPASADSWIELSIEHPEFFRTRLKEGRTERVALLSRYVLEYKSNERDKEKRLPLPPDITNSLMTTAVGLHDRQLQRRDRWKVIAALLVPMLVGLLAATAAIISAIISTKGK